MLAQIAAAVFQIASRVVSIYSIVSTILAVANSIKDALFPNGTVVDFNTMQGQVASIQAHVLDPTYGLQAIEAEVAANQTALLAAIAATQQTGSPVTLPVTPPTGYGSVDAATVATAVWFTVGPTNGVFALSMLENLNTISQFTSDWSNQIDFNDFAGWEMIPLNIATASLASADVCVTLDWTTVIASDASAVDWLNRVAGFPIVADQGGGVPGGSDGFGNFFSVPWLNTPTFQILRDKQLNLGQPTIPPVWPGVANVTLGSSTALTNGLMLTGPMDGVIVTILSAPPGKAKFAYGLIQAYQHLAALSFTDDDGHQEGFQPVQFEVGIYCPTTMVTAAGVIFRVDPAVTGTVQPWTNN